MLVLYLFAASCLCYVLVRVIFSPLSKIPGPAIAPFSSLYLKYQELTGNRRRYIHALHKKYGTVVRVAPREVCFANLEAMKEIYTAGGSGYDKTEFYSLFKQYNQKYVGDVGESLMLSMLCSGMLTAWA